jgi:hypothetical protein
MAAPRACLWRVGKSAITRRFSSALKRAQPAISSMLRAQPMQ